MKKIKSRRSYIFIGLLGACLFLFYLCHAEWLRFDYLFHPIVVSNEIKLYQKGTTYLDFNKKKTGDCYCI